MLILLVVSHHLEIVSFSIFNQRGEFRKASLIQNRKSTMQTVVDSIQNTRLQKVETT